MHCACWTGIQHETDAEPSGRRLGLPELAGLVPRARIERTSNVAAARRSSTRIRDCTWCCRSNGLRHGQFCGTVAQTVNIGFFGDRPRYQINSPSRGKSFPECVSFAPSDGWNNETVLRANGPRQVHRSAPVALRAAGGCSCGYRGAIRCRRRSANCTPRGMGHRRRLEHGEFLKAGSVLRGAEVSLCHRRSKDGPSTPASGFDRADSLWTPLFSADSCHQPASCRTSCWIRQLHGPLCRVCGVAWRGGLHPVAGLEEPTA